jgi:hypothetical protein
MAVDTKRLENWTCKTWGQSSNFVKHNQILYRLNENESDITIKYKRSDGTIIPPFTFPSDKLQGIHIDQALIEYVVTLEKKDEAIVLLKKYKEERSSIIDEYKVLPCISDFFRDSFLQPILGIPRQDKLDAVEEVITWLEESKTAESTLPLNLKPQHIKALTDKNLGEKIEAIRKLDAEFDSAFTAAIDRCRAPSTGQNFSIN